MYLHVLIPLVSRWVCPHSIVNPADFQQDTGDSLGLSGAATVIVFHGRPYLSGLTSLIVGMDIMVVAQIVIEPSVAFILSFLHGFFNLIGQMLFSATPLLSFPETHL